MATQIQLRRGTSAEWAASTRILAQGEVGIDLTLGEMRLGDGVTAWAGLTPIGAVDPADVDAAVAAYLLANPPAAAPVDSVNGQTGAVILDASDVGADAAGTAAAAVAALDIPAAAYPVQQVTLTAPLAYTLPVDAPADQVISVVFTQDGTGGHPVTYDSDPVAVDLTAGASTTVELHPVGAGYVVRYPGKPLAGLVYSNAKTDGTDQTATIQAELDALQSSGGGTLILPAGTIAIFGTITLPNDAATPVPAANSITIKGQGGQVTARGTMLPKGGTVIDIRGVDAHGKMKGNAVGLVALRDLVFKDSAGTLTPFLYTTNTTLDLRGCSFIGSKTGTDCDQDAIILGGPNQVEGDSDWDSGFQGYGTIISGNFFNKVRRAVYGRAFCNSVVISENTVWNASGFATGAAIELNGKPTGVGPQHLAATVVRDNLIEVVNYKYGISLDWAAQCTVAGNGIWDATATTTGGVYLGPNAQLNTVIEGYTSAGKIAVDDQGAVAGMPNRIYVSSQIAKSKLPATDFPDINYDTTIYRMKVTGGGDKFIIQPAATTADAASLLYVKRSAAEATNPGADVFRIQQTGATTAQGSLAGNRTYRNAAGAIQTTFTDNGRRWNCDPGGSLRIDSGPGGVLNLWNTLVNVLGPTGAGGSGIYVQNRTTTPATPTGGGVLYVEGGALKYVGSSGTVTTIAPA